MSTNGDAAADLLIFYMRRVWEEAGLGWESDNSAEMRNLVDRLVDAAREPAGTLTAEEFEAAGTATGTNRNKEDR